MQKSRVPLGHSGEEVVRISTLLLHLFHTFYTPSTLPSHLLIRPFSQRNVPLGFSWITTSPIRITVILLPQNSRGKPEMFCRKIPRYRYGTDSEIKWKTKGVSLSENPLKNYQPFNYGSWRRLCHVFNFDFFSLFPVTTVNAKHTPTNKTA